MTVFLAMDQCSRQSKRGGSIEIKCCIRGKLLIRLKCSAYWLDRVARSFRIYLRNEPICPPGCHGGETIIPLFIGSCRAFM
jgi:hypothetical protein